MSKKSRSGVGGGGGAQIVEYVTIQAPFGGKQVPIYSKIPNGFTIDNFDSRAPDGYIHIERWDKGAVYYAEGYIKREIAQRAFDDQERTLRGIPHEIKTTIHKIQEAAPTGLFPRGLSTAKGGSVDAARYNNIILRAIDKNYPILNGFKYKIWEAKNDEPAMYAVKQEGRITRADAKPLPYFISYLQDGANYSMHLGDIESARMGFIKSRMYIQAGLRPD